MGTSYPLWDRHLCIWQQFELYGASHLAFHGTNTTSNSKAYLALLNHSPIVTDFGTHAKSCLLLTQELRPFIITLKLYGKHM